MDVFGLSEQLWGDAPIDWIFGYKDQDYGWGVIDSFKNWSLVTALSSSRGVYNSEGNTYQTYELAGGTSAQNIVPDNTYYTIPSGYPIAPAPAGNYPNGVANVLYPVGTKLWTPGQLTLMGAGANTGDEASMQMGPATATSNVCPFSVVPGVSGSLLFEARLRVSGLGYVSGSIGSTFFMGFAGSGSAVSGRPCGAAFDTTTSLLGFGCLYTDTAGTLSLVYDKAGGTVQKSAAVLTLGAFPNSTTPTVGPNVYFKLGFRYEGKSCRLVPYINGVPQDGQLGNNCVLSSTITGSSTLWPADGMTLVCGIHQYGTTTFQKVTLDGWAAAQEPCVGAWGRY
jgi:hypothetical protein